MNIEIVNNTWCSNATDAGEAASKKKSANAIIVSDDDSDDFEILGNGEKKTKLSGDTKITAENF